MQGLVIMAKRGWGYFFTALLAMCVFANTLQEAARWHVALQHFHGVDLEFYSGQISDYLLCFAPSQAYMLVYTIDSRDALSSLGPVTREISKGTVFLLLAVPHGVSTPTTAECCPKSSRLAGIYSRVYRYFGGGIRYIDVAHLPDLAHLIPAGERIDPSAPRSRHAGEGRYPRLCLLHEGKSWMPAFAGMTIRVQPESRSFGRLVLFTA